MRPCGVCLLVLAAACAPDGTTIAAAPVTTMEDTPVSFTLDVMGPYTTAGVLQPVHGSATIEGLVVTYTPNSNFFGADVLRAHVTTDGSFAETAFDITVVPVNDAPLGFEDELAAVEDMPFTVAAEMLLANDMEIEGEPITITSVGNAVNGTVSLAQDSVTFVPDANFAGTATFEYVATDGMDSSSTTVALHVQNINDAPVAVADSATVAQNTPLELDTSLLLANDYDIDGGILSYTGATNCINCSIYQTDTFRTRIVPTQDFVGVATVDYTVSDGAATATATVTITVTP